MPKIYRRNCNTCGNYYEKANKKFCSFKCRILEFTDDVRKKMSASHKGKAPYIMTENIKNNISKNHADVSGKNNPNWKGGVSFLPYAPEFNSTFKNKIREKYNNICVLCGIKKHDNEKEFMPHHIDYNKQNTNEDNFVLLCKSCNTIVNFNRDFWKDYFENIEEYKDVIPPEVIKMKYMKRAFRPYVLILYEMIFESRPTNILEIGIGTQQQSTRTILAAMQKNNYGTLTSIDLGKNEYKINELYKKHWNLIVGNSHDNATLNKVNNKVYDLLLIDGDHSKEGCKMDYEMYSPLVKDGGFILLHDIINKNETMKEFWDELDVRGKISLNYGFAGLGIIQK